MGTAGAAGPTGPMGTAGVTGPAGARTFLIATTPNFGYWVSLQFQTDPIPNFALTPYVRALGPAAQLAAAYDGAVARCSHLFRRTCRVSNLSILTSTQSWAGLRHSRRPLVSRTQRTPVSPSASSEMQFVRRRTRICFGMASTQRTTGHSLVAAAALQVLPH
jgi:hypothetical protein